MKRLKDLQPDLPLLVRLSPEEMDLMLSFRYCSPVMQHYLADLVRRCALHCVRELERADRSVVVHLPKAFPKAKP
jgi:hypothetical protein